jgi:hypothetical protein
MVSLIVYVSVHFFEIESGQIARVSNHYNLADWIRQVEAA